MYERILLPTDGSEASEGAAEHAIAQARQFDAELHVLHVTDTGALTLDAHSQELYEAKERRGRSAVDDLTEQASRRGVGSVKGLVREGSPHRVVLDYVEEADCDLVVMGSHGRRGIDRYLLGSVTERVTRLSDVPVIVVPHHGED